MNIILKISSRSQLSELLQLKKV